VLTRYNAADGNSAYGKVLVLLQ